MAHSFSLFARVQARSHIVAMIVLRSTLHAETKRKVGLRLVSVLSKYVLDERVCLFVKDERVVKRLVSLRAMCSSAVSVANQLGPSARFTLLGVAEAVFRIST